MPRPRTVVLSKHRSGRADSSACRGSSRSRMTADMIEAQRRADRARGQRPARSPRARSPKRRSRTSTPSTSVGAYLTLLHDSRSQQAARVDERVARGEQLAARRRADRRQRQHVPERHAHDVRQQDPGKLDRAVHGDGRRAHARCRLRSDRQDEHATSSRWAARAKTRRSASRAIRTISRAFRAARAAARRRRSRRAKRRSGSAATPAARFASRAPSAISSDSSRPTGASRATA